MAVKSFFKDGAGCLLLFCLPFALVGGFMAYKCLDHLGKSFEVSSWDRVVASNVAVKSGETTKSTSDGQSTTHWIKGSYSYQYQGQNYRSGKIVIDSEGGFGLSYDAIEEEVKEKKKSGEVIEAYVNPDNPGESYLYAKVLWDNLFFYLIFVVTFGGVGFGGIWGSFYAAKVIKKENALKERYPDEPWKWKEDWLNQAIPASSKAKMYAAWGFAIFWNAISSPLFFVIPSEVGKGNYLILIAALFPIVGTGLFIYAIKATIQRKKFGETIFRMEEVPGVVGGYIRGSLEFPYPIQVGNKGFELKLQCEKTTGSGDDQKTSIIWQEKARLGRDILGGGHIARLPVKFAIPYDVQQTNEKARVKWKLVAKSELEGVDFGADFEVPVFITNQSEPNFEATRLEIEKIEPTDSDIVESKVIVTELMNGGSKYSIPPYAVRNSKGFLMTSLFTVVFTAISIGLGFSDASLIFPIVFGGFSLIMILISTSMLGTAREFKVDANGLELLVDRFIFDSRKTYKPSEIQSVEVRQTSSMQSGSDFKAFYSVSLVTTTHGKPWHVTLLNDLKSKRAAEFFRLEISKKLGLESDGGRDGSSGPWMG